MNELVVLVLWTVTALVALAVSMLALGGALADWEYLRERRLNGLRSIQAGANLRTQATRAIVSLLFLVIGVLAMLKAPMAGEVGRWCLVVASVVLTAGSVMDWVDRRRMVALIIRQEHAP